jgi:hypothetical protein
MYLSLLFLGVISWRAYCIGHVLFVKHRIEHVDSLWDQFTQYRLFFVRISLRTHARERDVGLTEECP